MKKTNRYISLLLALVFAAGLSSCIKEDYADSTKNDKATVSLVFDTRAPGVDGQTVQAGPNEGIKTLRVIIVDSKSSTVNVNKFYDYSAEPGPVETKKLTIMNLPVGQKDFYVIANEGSVEMNGIKLDTWQEKGTFNESDKNELLQAVIASGFPKTDAEIVELGLPIAGWQSENITGTEDQVIEIPITRAVAKFVLYINNESGETFDLNSVNLGTFVADRTYLFPGQNGLPQGVTYNEKKMYSLNANTTVAANDDGKGEPAFIGYIYETGTRDAGDFTLSLTSDTRGFEDLAKAVPIQFNQQGRKHISRNEQVEITATVDVNKEVQTDLKILVVHWGKKVIEVPSFN